MFCRPSNPRDRKASMAGALLILFVGATSSGSDSEAASNAEVPNLTAEAVVAKHLEARGGAERWREVEAIEMTGTYSAFSEQSTFRWVGAKGDLYRLDFELLGAPAVRARDSEGPWWRHKLMNPDPGRLDAGPYKAQVERESIFGPVLLDYDKRGLTVELVGPGEVEGIPTIDLEVTFPDESVETWRLDAETGLEVAIDSQVQDFTQGMAPMRQRAFFDDFRKVDGVVIPFHVDLEFGARLESMVVEDAVVDPELADDAFTMPAAESGPDAEGDS